MGGWWRDPSLRGYIIGVLSHLNHAMEISTFALSTNVCRSQFDALNRLWEAYTQHEGANPRADTPSFISLLKSLAEDSRSTLFTSSELANLIALTPEVMDHSKLKEHGYKLDVEPSDSLRHKATEQHRKLRDTYLALKRGESSVTYDHVLKKLAQFLYVIRSNIAHGEKTPYGPNLAKAKRDEQVSNLAVPVQKLIIYLILDRPDWKLAAYGSLVPGGANEHLLKECNGDWKLCKMHGQIREQNSLKFFRWDPYGSVVEGSLLISQQLKDYWSRLDRFEGDRYQRGLIPIEVDDALEVATIYMERLEGER